MYYIILMTDNMNYRSLQVYKCTPFIIIFESSLTIVEYNNLVAEVGYQLQEQK